MKSLFICAAIIILSVPVFFVVHNRGEANLKMVLSENASASAYTVILDAGHGGEDGGAVAPDGTPEKDINLSIANMIADYFDLFGISYIPVRKTDCSVGDLTLGTVKARKTSDIMTRYSLVNNTPDSVLLSIHQNQFKQSKYRGTQVFFAPGDQTSERIANAIQKAVVGNLQPENKREVKASGDSIYLLYHAKRPSVLVECGFLSNPEELSELKNKEYMSKLSFFIIEGLIFGIQTEKI